MTVTPDMKVFLQTLLISFGVVFWCRKPARWKNVAGGVSMGLVLLMCIAGVLAALR